MAFVFDGFEIYANATMWLRDPSHVQYQLDGFTSNGRRGGNAIKVGTSTHYFGWLTGSTDNTFVFGIALYQYEAGTPSSNNSYPLIKFRDDASNLHLKFLVNSSGLIEVKDSANTLLGTTSGHQVQYRTWTFIEIKVVISNTVGQVTIEVDEVERLSTAANLDTLNGSNAYVGEVMVYGLYNNLETYFDDAHFCDGAETNRNDLLGDLKVDALFVSGAGSHTEFTPSAGSNFQNVDEAQSDDDSTYNDGDTTNDEDSYAMDNLSSPAGSSILGVRVVATIRKTDAGSRKAKLIGRFNGTDYYGSEEDLSDSYKIFTKIWDQNPDDSADFEDADVNGMEAGLKVTA